MARPLEIDARIYGLNSAETFAAGLPCRVMGPVSRTIGLAGDRLSVLVKRSDWDAVLASGVEAWDLTKPFKLIVDGPFPIHYLAGYLLRSAGPSLFGEDRLTGVVSGYAIRLDLVTEPGFLRDGRGGLIRAKTFNPLGPDGLVDTAHDDYRSVSALVDIALDALGLDHDAAPASLDTHVDGETTRIAPGPLDWGNAGAFAELEALLAYAGHTAIWDNSQRKIRVVRLKRAGESITWPGVITDNLADADDINGLLVQSRGVRASTIVVTSGETRSAIVTRREFHFAPFDYTISWVALDEGRTGLWLGGNQWRATYPGEIAPDEIAEFRKGPTGDDGDPERAEVWGTRLFRAVALSQLEDLKVFGSFVTLGAGQFSYEWPEASGVFYTLDRTPAIAFARCAQPAGDGLLTEYPINDEDWAFIPVVETIAGEDYRGGVFVLDPSKFFVRGPDAGDAKAFAYKEATALAGSDLVVLFACEAKTGDPKWDYFTSVWAIDSTGGTLTASRVTDEGEIAAAIASAESVKIHDTNLRRVLGWIDPDLESDPTPLNDDDLHAHAEQLALAYGADERVAHGRVELAGIHDIQPGDVEGAVTAVDWDYDRLRTIVFANSHEISGAVADRIAQAVGRSLAGGSGRAALGRSSVDDVAPRVTTRTGVAT